MTNEDDRKYPIAHAPDPPGEQRARRSQPDAFCTLQDQALLWTERVAALAERVFARFNVALQLPASRAEAAVILASAEQREAARTQLFALDQLLAAVETLEQWLHEGPAGKNTAVLKEQIGLAAQRQFAAAEEQLVALDGVLDIAVEVFVRTEKPAPSTSTVH